jgi:GMP synthase (glutamine-hydrolysing)
MKPPKLDRVKFLLLQVRNTDDPMLRQEWEVFSAAVGCPPGNLDTANLLLDDLIHKQAAVCDVVLIGGSGDYSAAATVTSLWLDRTCELLQELHQQRKPIFASCWGFQALARALGGEVVCDPGLAELGTHEIFLTQDGKKDPVFGPLGDRFRAPIGHEDSVIRLPTCSTLIGRSQVANQIFRMDDAPIYATQFHPELTRKSFLERVERYPKYVTQIRGSSYEQFAEECQETPKMGEILPRFLSWVLA